MNTPRLRLLVATAATLLLGVVAYAVLQRYTVEGGESSQSLALAIATVSAVYFAVCLSAERFLCRSEKRQALLSSATAVLLLSSALTLAGIFTSLVFRSAASFAIESPTHWELLYRASGLAVKLPVRTALSCALVAIGLVFAFSRLSPSSRRPAPKNAA